MARTPQTGPAADLREAIELHKSGKLSRAEKLYQRTLAARPDDVEALMSLGILKAQRGSPVAAVALLQKAARLAPKAAAVHYNLGRACLEAERFEEAVAALLHTLALAPGHGDSHNNLATAFRHLGRTDEAVAHYRSALAHDQGLADAAFNLGLLLSGMDRPRETVEAFMQAASRAPRDPRAHYELGIALEADGQAELAAKAYGQVLRLDPGHRGALSRLAHARRQLADWQGLDVLEARVIAAATGRPEPDQPAMHPFALLALSDDPALQLEAARRHVQRIAVPAASSRPPLRVRAAGERIRLAYVSGDFRAHAVAFLIAGLIEAHDRSRFDVVGVSLGSNDGGHMRKRLEAQFSALIDAQTLSPAATAAAMREREIDIAIDLAGYTHHGRPQIFANRAAPVQVSYLGWSSTTGARHMDYLLADRIVIPESERQHYSEAIVDLPGCYLPGDRTRDPGVAPPSCSDCGLPETGVVFNAFNNIYKISPALFDVWIDIVKSTPGSVLWIRDDNPTASANLKREAAARGLDPARLVLAPRVPSNADHMARLVHADLFLDTVPYGAHTTASDALLMGVPVVTCAGRTFAARVATSLLSAAGLSELVATSLADYAAKAKALAADPDRLHDLKARVAAPALSAALFDPIRHCRAVERAFEAMMERLRRGQPPAAISVEPVR